MPIKRIFILIILVIGLTSCFCEKCPGRKNLQPCGELIDSLQTQDVQIIQLGDTLRLILPVDKFFEPASVQVKRCKAKTLREIAELTICHCYALSNIRVSGYSDTVGTISDQKWRSLHQAQNIAAYLWGYGIPLNRMIVRGFGARGTIAGNATPSGEAANRRVEITLP